MEALQSRPSTSGRKFDPVEVCPLLYTTRIATAKILIELEDWDNATKVHINKIKYYYIAKRDTAAQHLSLIHYQLSKLFLLF